MEKLIIDDTYELIEDLKNGRFECLRYGESWRNLVGDNMVMAMMHRIQVLEEELRGFKGNIIDKETHDKIQFYLDQC